MKKILIVDDNENNRMLLRAVFDMYLKNNPQEKLIVDEAINGVEAVALSHDHPYDLIMMDIMMPEMDGIEATKQIRKNDPKVMIIAVSAVEDTTRQKEILENGAEDYISKPINIDILNHRLKQYFSLIDSRKRKITPHQNAHNLFTQSVLCRELHFNIQNEHDLAEFWEYYLLNPEMKMVSESLSDTVRTFYAIGAMALNKNINPLIIIEESENHLYFTLESIHTLEPKIVHLTLAKLNARIEFKYDQEKLSIKLSLDSSHRSPIIDRALDTPPLSQPLETAPMSVPETTLAAAETIPVVNQTLEVYDYMDYEDLENIRDYLNRLNTLLLMVGSGDIHNEEAYEIAEYLNKIGKVTSTYSESYPIGRALNELSDTLRSHSQEFIDKSTSLGTLCAAFSRDLMSWIRLIFEEGATNVNYMDDTIITNAQMIGNMLSMDTISNDAADLDDIFDF